MSSVVPFDRRFARLRPLRGALLAPLTAGFLAALLHLSATSARAEDQAVLAPLKAGSPPVTLRGEVLDYRGDGLRFRLTSGKEETFDPRRLIALETDWPPDLALGEAAWRAGRWDEALERLRAASAGDARPWVKRRVLARAVECLRDARRIGEAGEAFLTLYRLDDSTPYFAAIPLDWTLDAPAAIAVETKAREWLRDDPVPPAVLLGASWSLGRPDRPQALAALQRLTKAPDPRLAGLASAQLWLARSASADGAEIERWRQLRDRLPADLRPGPTFVVARTLARQGASAQAALEWLRIPVLHPDQRELAALALFSAAAELHRTPGAAPQDPTGLYREIVDRHPTSSIAASARAQLDRPTDSAASP